MESLELDRIEITHALCSRLADLLCDPTDGGKKTLESDKRATAREGLRADLVACIDTLAAGAHFSAGFLDVLSIASKHNHVPDTKKQ